MVAFLLVFTVLQSAVNSDFVYSSMAFFAIGLTVFPGYSHLFRRTHLLLGSGARMFVSRVEDPSSVKRSRPVLFPLHHDTPTKTIRFLSLHSLHAMTCVPKSVPYSMRLDILLRGQWSHPLSKDELLADFLEWIAVDLRRRHCLFLTSVCGKDVPTFLLSISCCLYASLTLHSLETLVTLPP